jgi:branched-chain amino acid transport system permease protein
LQPDCRGIIAPLIGIYPTFLMKCWCFALFACAFNLLWATRVCCRSATPRFSAAGYFAGHAIKVWGLPPELGILAAHCVRRRTSATVWQPRHTPRRIYFAMVTLALAQMLYFVWLQ